MEETTITCEFVQEQYEMFITIGYWQIALLSLCFSALIVLVIAVSVRGG